MSQQRPESDFATKGKKQKNPVALIPCPAIHRLLLQSHNGRVAQRAESPEIVWRMESESRSQRLLPARIAAQIVAFRGCRCETDLLESQRRPASGEAVQLCSAERNTPRTVLRRGSLNRRFGRLPQSVGQRVRALALHTVGAGGVVGKDFKSPHPQHRRSGPQRDRVQSPSRWPIPRS